jgi:hypothetical protein
LSTSRCSSSCAEPRCSMSRAPRREVVHDLHRPRPGSSLHRPDLGHHGTLRAQLVRTSPAPDTETRRSATRPTAQRPNVAQGGQAPIRPRQRPARDTWRGRTSPIDHSDCRAAKKRANPARCDHGGTDAKKAEAALRISLARRSSATSRLSRLISADSSLVAPGRRPASTSAWRTHLRTSRRYRPPVSGRPRRSPPTASRSSGPPRDHPHRPLTQLGRVVLVPTYHDSISSEESPDTPGGFSTRNHRRRG